VIRLAATLALILTACAASLNQRDRDGNPCGGEGEPCCRGFFRTCVKSLECVGEVGGPDIDAPASDEESYECARPRVPPPPPAREHNPAGRY
jgi:hypothetical protein